MAAIKVYVKLPGRAPYSTHMSNKLENFQRAVEGYIETVTIAEDCVLIVNEEGRINGQPYNCTVCGHELFGPVIFAGVFEDELSDIPVDFKQFKELFPELWEVK